MGDYSDKFENDAMPDHEELIPEEDQFGDLAACGTTPEQLVDAAFAERYRKWLMNQ